MTVTAGTVCVTARADLVSISVSPGEWRNKDRGAAGGSVPTFECTDLFTPPPATWTVEDTPACGYTYKLRSLKDRTGGTGKWTMTVAAHWRVTWTSTGAGGAGGVIEPPAAVTTWPLQLGEWRSVLVAGEN